jgi:hypothetical protein
MSDPKHMVTIQAQVTDYLSRAMNDHFDDGTFATYDATALEILAPDTLKGSRLLIYHSNPPAGDSIWRAVGSRFQCELPGDLLEGRSLLFAGAVQGLTRMPD